MGWVLTAWMRSYKNFLRNIKIKFNDSILRDYYSRVLLRFESMSSYMWDEFLQKYFFHKFLENYTITIMCAFWNTKAIIWIPFWIHIPSQSIVQKIFHFEGGFLKKETDPNFIDCKNLQYLRYSNKNVIFLMTQL